MNEESSDELKEFCQRFGSELQKLLYERLVELRDRKLADTKLKGMATISAGLMHSFAVWDAVAMCEGGLIQESEIDETSDEIQRLMSAALDRYYGMHTPV